MNNYVFCSNRIRTLVAMATYSFHWLIMEKVEIGIYCYLTVDILTKALQKCSLSSPLWSIWILSKLLNLIGCHGNRKDKFAKKCSKIFSSEAIRGMNLKLCRNVHNISLYKNYFLYCHWSFHWLVMGNVKVGLHCYLTTDILTKVLQRCSLSNPLPNVWILSKPLNLIGCHGNQKDKFTKENIQKSSPQKP